MWPTSSQCGMPRIVRSCTMTAPTNLRAHVDRVATVRAMFMKYSSQLTRCGGAVGLSPCEDSTALSYTAAASAERGTRPPRPDRELPHDPHESDRGPKHLRATARSLPRAGAAWEASAMAECPLLL